MTEATSNFRHIVFLMVVVGIATAVAGCGRTLVFVERDGINLAIRANASSSPPIEVNFGMNRTIATIVPPTAESGGKPAGDAVSMFAGFQVDNTLDVTKPLNADLQIDTQFASGGAAKAVAGKPSVVSQIANLHQLTYSSSSSSQQLSAWLLPDGKNVSTNRRGKLQAWLDQFYPSLHLFPAALVDDAAGGNNETVRQAALADKTLMSTTK